MRNKSIPLLICVPEGIGNKTETAFLQQLNRECDSVSIIVKRVSKTDIPGMWKESVKLADENGIRLKLKDHVFIVVDDDDDERRHKQIEEYETKDPRVGFVVSKPIFENWILSYFEVPRKGDNKKTVIKKLSKHIANYSKDGTYCRKLWVGSSNPDHEKAIKNYRTTFKKEEETALSVADLVELIIDYANSVF